MATLTPALVDRWFDRVLDARADSFALAASRPDGPVPGPDGAGGSADRWPAAVDLRLSDDEQQVLGNGRRWMLTAVGGGYPADPVDPRVRTRSLLPGHATGSADAAREAVARRLATFLTVLSAAIGDTRSAVARAAGSADGLAPLAGEAAGESTVQPDALALAAGVNAAAAALATTPFSSRSTSSMPTPSSPSPFAGRSGRSDVPFADSTGPTAATAARRAGEAAAEAAVGGADLATVAGLAAVAMLSGWTGAELSGWTGAEATVPSGGPPHAEQWVDLRVRALVGRVMVALQQVTRPPDPPALPAPCGAGPGDVLGRVFPAEITCQIAVADAQVDTLRTELQGLGDVVSIWPRSAGSVAVAGAAGGAWQRVHVHSDRPGAVVEALFAGGSVFDLQITALD